MKRIVRIMTIALLAIIMMLFVSGCAEPEVEDTRSEFAELVDSAMSSISSYEGSIKTRIVYYSGETKVAAEGNGKLIVMDDYEGSPYYYNYVTNWLETVGVEQKNVEFIGYLKGNAYTSSLNQYSVGNTVERKLCSKMTQSEFEDYISSNDTTINIDGLNYSREVQERNKKDDGWVYVISGFDKNSISKFVESIGADKIFELGVLDIKITAEITDDYLVKNVRLDFVFDPEEFGDYTLPEFYIRLQLYSYNEAEPILDEFTNKKYTSIDSLLTLKYLDEKMNEIMYRNEGSFNLDITRINKDKYNNSTSKKFIYDYSFYQNDEFFEFQGVMSGEEEGTITYDGATLVTRVEKDDDYGYDDYYGYDDEASLAIDERTAREYIASLVGYGYVNPAWITDIKSLGFGKYEIYFDEISASKGLTLYGTNSTFKYSNSTGGKAIITIVGDTVTRVESYIAMKGTIGTGYYQSSVDLVIQSVMTFSKKK